MKFRKIIAALALFSSFIVTSHSYAGAGEGNDSIGEAFAQCSGMYDGLFEYRFNLGQDPETAEDSKLPEKLALANKIAAEKFSEGFYVKSIIPLYKELFRSRLEQYGMAQNQEAEDYYLKNYNDKCSQLAQRHLDSFKEALIEANQPAEIVQNGTNKNIPGANGSLSDVQSISNEDWCRNLATQSSFVVSMASRGASVEQIKRHVMTLGLSPDDQDQYLKTVDIALLQYSGQNPARVFSQELNACLEENR